MSNKDNKKLRLLSLFSGCGGMDLGFTGGFDCLSKSVNRNIHNDWIKEDKGNWITLQETKFDTIFANDIRQDAQIAWTNYFSKFHKDSTDRYKLESIVELVKAAEKGEFKFPENVSIVTGGIPLSRFFYCRKTVRIQFSKKSFWKETSSR